MHFANKVSMSRNASALIQRRGGIYKCCRPTQPRTAQEVFDEFKQNTSLLGIQHILRKKSIFWFVAYLTCSALSIFQSWGAADEFFSHKVTQKYMIASKRNLPFPSVTVCSNAVVSNDYDYSGVENYNKKEEDRLQEKRCDSEEDSDNWEAIVNKNELFLIKHLRNLTVEQREKESVNISEFVHSCMFGSDKCQFENSSEVYIFNSPYFGNCFTFNPGIYNPMEVDLQRKLTVVLKLGLGYKQVGMGKRRVGVLLHAAGSAPIFDSAAVQDIYGGRFVDFTLKFTQKKFIKRYDSKAGHYTCVEDTEEDYQKNSIFYTDEMPYKYSVEACMKSCEQRHVKTKCDDYPKLDATLPIIKDEETINFTLYVPPVECKQQGDLNMETCGCLLPCSLDQFIINSDTTEITLHECDAQQMVQASNATSPDAKKVNKSLRVKFAVSFLSNIIECVEEEGKYTISEFLGILGGNMSLWIGLCVLSILEVFELVWNLILVKCSSSPSQLDNKKISSSSTSSSRPFALNNTGHLTDLEAIRRRASLMSSKPPFTRITSNDTDLK